MIQEQPELHDQLQHEDNYTPIDEQYTTHINQLISEPAGENMATTTAQYILSSLYQLSSYLFTKKIRGEQEMEGHSPQLQMSFQSYLHLMGDDLGLFQKLKSTRRIQPGRQTINMQSQLLRCYQKVQGIYFKDSYVLDLSYFEYFYRQLKSRKDKNRVDNELDKLCECLDLVEINLFSQIHCKFQQYFHVVANFQYLKDSVNLHIKKLSIARSGIAKVKRQFLDKSVNLRRKIVQRQNIEKTLKLIKQVKSIKKLPQVLQSILASSLPYESLSLLQDTRSIVENLQQLNCTQTTSQSIRGMQILVQNDLTKRYASQLYLYLQECHCKDKVDLQDLWKKIETHTCLDKDSSFVLDQLNSSTSSVLSDNPQLTEQLQLLDSHSDAAIASSILIPRNQGVQYQIAMILLQSYKYVQFSPELTKIKVCNALRMFAKRFQKQLLTYLQGVVSEQIQQIKVKESKKGQSEEIQGVGETEGKEKKEEDVVERVSVQFYIKHLGLLNQIFKETINRFLGFLHTLLTEYEQQISNDLAQQPNSTSFLSTHKKFKQIFTEQCSLLPSIFKIIQQKIKYLLTLKNISNIDSLQFYRWITTLKYWTKYFDHLIISHPLLNHQPRPQTKIYIDELTGVVEESVRKAVQTMNLQNLLLELTRNYVQVYHKNTINNQILTALHEDTWQSTEVPPDFSDILHSIFHPDGNALNASVTILDTSTSSNNNILNSSTSSSSSAKNSLNNSRHEDSAARTKIKLLKNNIQIGGIRYKVNLSFLILCQQLAQYMKVARILSRVFESPSPPYKKILSIIYDKLFNLAQIYASRSKELILDGQALKVGAIKTKNINAKHICLLSNSLSVVEKVTEDMIQIGRLQSLGLKERRQQTLNNLRSIRELTINKLSLILNSKTQKDISVFVEADKINSTPELIKKTSNSLITAFLQMVDITDEYLCVQEVRQVLKAAFQTLSQKYVTYLLLKGNRLRSDVEVLIEKLKFLRKYFSEEYQKLMQEIPK